MKRSASFLWILKRARRRWLGLAVLLLSKMGVSVLGVGFALGSKNVIDTAIHGNRESFYVACAWQAAIIIGTLVCLFLSRHMHDKLQADLDRDWKRDLLHGLLRGEYAAVSRYHSGELINRLNNDVRVIHEGLVSAIPNLAGMVVKLIAALAVLWSMEPWFALVLCGCGGVMIAATGLLRRKLKTLYQKVSEHDGKVSAFLQETLEKLLLVQAMDVAAENERRCDSHLEDRYNMQRKRKNVSLLANTSISIATYGASFAALIWCAAQLLEGQMSFGTLTAITQLVSQLQAPFAGVSSALPQYVAMTAAAERLMELEALPQEKEPMEEDPRQIYREARSLCARGLHFSYDRDPVLADAAFDLPIGAFAVITGPSGIGKSTLLKLLLGIFPPDAGEMYFDWGERKLPVDRGTRRMFAYVPQGNLLFSGSVRENLLIAKPDATEEQIRHATYISAMDEYLEQLPNGLDTVLGESGAGLSEGQAQRLALGRAVLCDAPILLLDESTSALDPQTERTVLERIRGLQDRSCIAVTHRPAAVELFDWHIEIDKNQVRLHKNR